MTEYQEDEVKIIDWQESLVHQVNTEWERGQQYCDELNSMYETLYAMMRGDRPEKTYDWQSNIVINKVFQVVWTTIPYVVQKVFGASPVIGVKGPDRMDKGAHHREKILEFWNTFQPGNSKNHTPFFLILVSWTLRSLLNGVGFLKKTWHQNVETQSTNISSNIPKYNEFGEVIGLEPHKTTRKRTNPLEDWPYNVVVNNRDIVVDWLLQPGQSCRQGRFIIHREMTDLDALLNSKIDYINLDELDFNENSTSSDTNDDASSVKGKDGQQTPPESDVYTDVEVYERLGSFPVYNEKVDGQWIPCFEKEDYKNGDAKFMEMVCTTVPSQNKLIRFEPNVYRELNYIDMHIFLDAERWQSMGQVEPFKDLQTALSDNLNAAFDEIWQNLMTPAVVNKSAMWDWDTMQYAPGQKWMVSGDPTKSIMWKPTTNITQDAWQKHMLLDNEIKLTSKITPPMQGMGKEKAATTNILNAQMSGANLDFIVKMIEITGIIPSAQMDVRFASMFAHPKTFQKILGEMFRYGDFGEELYKYIPAASSVKLEHQKEIEINQDMQLLQVLANFNNPKTAAVLNVLLQNIFRNRNMEVAAAQFDEEHFEPRSEAGNIQQIKGMIESGSESNEQGIEQSPNERSVRQIGMTRR